MAVAALTPATTGAVTALTSGTVVTVDTSGAVTPLTTAPTGLAATALSVELTTEFVALTSGEVIEESSEPRVLTARSANSRTPARTRSCAACCGVR